MIFIGMILAPTSWRFKRGATHQCSAHLHTLTHLVISGYDRSGYISGFTKMEATKQGRLEIILIVCFACYSGLIKIKQTKWLAIIILTVLWIAVHNCSLVGCEPHAVYTLRRLKRHKTL